MTLDLKPLGPETIHKMGYATHDLWVIKINDEIYGPFELESLKHYANENEEKFEFAQASRTDTNDWHPFFSYAQFKPIADAHQKPEKTPTKFWVVILGQKSGPVSRLDIEKKMELGILNMNDLVSMDDGETWKKLYQTGLFEIESSGPDALPNAPQIPDSMAQDELLSLMGDHDKNSYQNGLAALTFLGSQKSEKGPKLEEFDLQSLNRSGANPWLWLIPASVAGLGVFVLAGKLLMAVPSSSELVVKDDRPEVIAPRVGKQAESTTRARRQPASLNPNRPRNLTSGLMPQTSSTPTIYESHSEPHQPEPDYPPEPMAEAEPPQDAAAENSLVSQNAQPAEGESLDQSMTPPEPAPEPAPVVEETGDF